MKGGGGGEGVSQGLFVEKALFREPGSKTASMRPTYAHRLV